MPTDFHHTRPPDASHTAAAIAAAVPPERRADYPAMMMLLQTMHDQMRGMDERLTEHMATETGDLAAEVAKIMSNAFPDGDPDGHRRHHELVIARAEASAAFWRKMLEEVTKYGLVGFIGWLGYTAWQAFLQGPHK